MGSRKDRRGPEKRPARIHTTPRTASAQGALPEIFTYPHGPSPYAGLRVALRVERTEFRAGSVSPNEENYRSLNLDALSTSLLAVLAALRELLELFSVWRVSLVIYVIYT